MIENGIARFEIAQKINQRNLIALRARERAHDEVEIRGGKARPTIRPDHRDFIMRDARSDGKSDFSTQINLEARNQGIVAVALRATRALPAAKRLQPSGFMTSRFRPPVFLVCDSVDR